MSLDEGFMSAIIRALHAGWVIGGFAWHKRTDLASAIVTKEVSESYDLLIL
jgi:hypothetical protein